MKSTFLHVFITGGGFTRTGDTTIEIEFGDTVPAWKQFHDAWLSVLPTAKNLPLVDFAQDVDISGAIWAELVRYESVPRKLTIRTHVVGKSKRKIIDAIDERETVFRGPEKGDRRDFEVPLTYSWRSYMGLDLLIHRRSPNFTCRRRR